MAAGTIDLYDRVFGSGGNVSMTASEGVFLNDTPEKEELGQKVMRDLAGSGGNYQSWEGLAREDNRYYNSHQWDDLDRMQMEQMRRPALTFNDIKPIVDAVSGLERLNRTDIRVVSRALDSSTLYDLAGDLASEAISTSDDLCNAVEEDSNLAKTASITGMGWGEVKMDYTHDLNGRVVWAEFPCWEGRWDPNSRRPNLEDSEWRARKRDISRKQFEKLWPGNLEKVDMAVPDMPYGQTQKYELVTPYYSIANEKANPQVGNQTQVKKTVEVIQYQWRDMQPIYRFQDPDSGEVTTLDEDKWKRMSDRMTELGSAPPPAVKQFQPVYRQVYVARGVVLEDPVDLPGGFSLICMTGLWDDDKKRWYGIVRPMLDPQKTKNKAISAALGFHITNAKGGLIFKTSAFADPIAAKDQWSRYDAWIEADDAADIKNDIVPRTPAQMPAELGMFFNESTKAITRSSGVNEEMVGMATGQTPSQTAGHRSQAGLVVLGWFFDNLNRHRRERAMVTLEFIREFWTQGQFIQVGGDTNSQALPLLKESLPERFGYSFVLDDSIRHNPNLKAQIWTELMQSGVLQALMKFGMGQIILKLLKYSPFPTQLVNDINREVAQNPPQPPQKGRGKQDDPNLVAAKTRLFDAQTQKALAQAREIDSKPGMQVGQLMLEGWQSAHQVRQGDELAQHRRNMDVRKAMQPKPQPDFGG